MDLIPCLVVSGYLGAGKTTLINQFLAQPNGVRAVVLVNDFGKVNIDAHLIENASENTIELSNGCACCSIGDNLLRAAQQAAQRQPRPDVIVVESSGVAQPDRIATLLLGAAGVAPAQIITVVDVSQARAALNDKYISHLFSHQVAVANWLAPNRVGADLGDVLRHLSARPSGALRQITALTQVLDDLALGAENGTVRQDIGAAGDGDYDIDHFSTQTVLIPQGTPHDRVAHWLSAMPDHIHRVKGFARLRNADGTLTLYALSKTRAQVCIDKTTAVIPTDVVGQIVLISPLSVRADEMDVPIL